MSQALVEILIASMLTAVLSSLPFLFYAVFRSRQVPLIWDAIDLLKKDKAEGSDFKEVDGRVRAVEIEFANKMGRLDATINNLEKLEKEFKTTVEDLKGYKKHAN